MRGSRNWLSGLLVIGSCLGLYVVCAVCINWMITQPAVATAYRVVASPAAVVEARFFIPTASKQPSAVPSELFSLARIKPARSAIVPARAVAPELVESTAAAPKKEMKK